MPKLNGVVNGGSFEIWLGVILLNESNLDKFNKISFGVYFLPLSSIKEEYLAKYKKGIECKTSCLIEEAKKHGFFFESEGFKNETNRRCRKG